MHVARYIGPIVRDGGPLESRWVYIFQKGVVQYVRNFCSRTIYASNFTHHSQGRTFDGFLLDAKQPQRAHAHQGSYSRHHPPPYYVHLLAFVRVLFSERLVCDREMNPLLEPSQIEGCVYRCFSPFRSSCDVFFFLLVYKTNLEKYYSRLVL